MATTPREVTATRSVLLELQDELRFTREGHELLDQKRMLIAAELLNWLARYGAIQLRFVDAENAARRSLAEAVARHGLDELAVHPSAHFETRGVGLELTSFLGVPIARSRGGPNAGPPAEEAINSSPETRRCRECFAGLLSLAIELSFAQGNVLRLLGEYQRSERRARALEDVILPELELTLKQVDEKLEEQDREEAARLDGRSAGRRLHARRTP